MAKALVETLVDDLDGSPAVETILLGWNGDWRELDLSKRNVAALSRAVDRYWGVHVANIRVGDSAVPGPRPATIGGGYQIQCRRPTGAVRSACRPTAEPSD